MSKSALQACHTVIHIARLSAQWHLIIEVEEATLVDWCKYLVQTAHPLTRKTVNYVIKQLCGHAPGKHWLRKFLKRHAHRLLFGNASGLDPKSVRAFDWLTISHQFELLMMICKKYDIPPENIWNWDEKGVELGGGRTGSRTKYVLSRHSRSKYKTSNADLELVTVMECVNAAGDWMPPGVVFEGQQLMKCWFQDENISAGRWECTCFDTRTAD